MCLDTFVSERSGGALPSLTAGRRDFARNVLFSRSSSGRYRLTFFLAYQTRSECHFLGRPQGSGCIPSRELTSFFSLRFSLKASASFGSFFETLLFKCGFCELRPDSCFLEVFLVLREVSSCFSSSRQIFFLPSFSHLHLPIARFFFSAPLLFF